MRVAVVHSFYVSSTPSGENLAVLREVKALTSAGHDVHLVARNTDDLATSPLYAMTSAMRVSTGWGGDPSAELRAFNPDITHVHNLFPNIGTAWLKHWNGPVVTTLHNFRPLCANGILFRDGATCTECPDGSARNAVKHSCYRDSKVATLPLAIANRGGLERNPLLQRANKIIVLSDRAQSIYTKYGLAGDKIAIIPNGLDIPTPVDNVVIEPSNWVGIGRLTPEKGFADLIGSWPSSRHLDIIGTGPEEDAIRTIAGPGVRLLPPMNNKDLMELVPDYAGLVLPSKCFEGLPTVVLEALGSAVPVIAREGNSASDFFNVHEPSWVYDGTNSSLERALDSVESRGIDARIRARQLFDEKFSLRSWVKELEKLFNTLL